MIRKQKRFAGPMLLGAVCLFSLVSACSSSDDSESSKAIDDLLLEIEELTEQLELETQSESASELSTTTVPPTTTVPVATTVPPAPPTTTVPPTTTTVTPLENTPDCEINIMPGTVPSLCGFHIGDSYQDTLLGLIEILGTPSQVGWFGSTCRGGYGPETLETSVTWGNLRVSYLQKPDPDFDFSWTVYQEPYMANWTINFMNLPSWMEEKLITPDMVPLPGGADIEGPIEPLAEAFSFDLADGTEAPYMSGELPEDEYWINMMEYLEEEDYPEGFDGPEFGIQTGFILHQHAHFDEVTRTIGAPSIPYC